MINKHKFLALSLIVFLLSGLVLGFLIGGHTTQGKWVSFYEEKEKEIEEYCTCDYIIEMKFNLDPINFLYPIDKE